MARQSRNKAGLMKPVKNSLRMTSRAVRKSVSAVNNLVRGSLKMIGTTSAAVARTTSNTLKRMTRRTKRRATRRHR